ncbi:MAG TPA: AraC family transcriptional regulator [Stellaceae bacterium]|nr:AraC family transcriptional regulator [Stellaceae bacterium]
MTRIDIDGVPVATISPPIRGVLSFMEANFAEPLSLAQLARLSNLSLYRFATVFRREVGLPPHQYLCRLRISHAQFLLRQGTSPATVAMDSGFFDQSHLCRHFKRLCGVTPGQFVATSRGSGAPAGFNVPLPAACA